MAEALKDQYGVEVPQTIAESIAAVYPQFKAKDFLIEVLHDYETLELMPRGRHIARTLHKYLPQDYPEAIKILLASIGEPLEHTNTFGMAPFIYLPHTHFIAEFGSPLEQHFDISMQAQHQLTQRFTAEFSIRPFLIKYPERTLELLHHWTLDENQHVRRLVSEGTRPRLPWACRLPEFMRDPTPVLSLLEKLKDDSELYVRRSVANNLNDIGKDHPHLLGDTCETWLKNASVERTWLVKHALRSAIKRGERGALTVLGYGKSPKLELSAIEISPKDPRIGESIKISFKLANPHKEIQRVMVDFTIHYIKANGKSSPKTFKLKACEIAVGDSQIFSKKISLKEMSTRKHYVGIHSIDLQLNGFTRELGSFDLLK